MKVVDGDSLVRLTSAPEPDTAPAWLPDGRQVAFLRNSGPGGEIYLVGALGGAERRLIRSNGRSLAWTQDSRSLLVMNRDTEGGPFSIDAVSVDSGEKRHLTSPPSTAIGDYNPVASPDGHRLAFARFDRAALTEIYVASLRGGEPTRITRINGSVFGLAWTPDGRDIVFAADILGRSGLWRVEAVKDAAPVVVLPTDALVRRPSIPRTRGSRDRIFCERSQETQDLLIVSLSSGSPARAERLVPSTRSSSLAQFSPDGARVAFASNRSGYWDIWSPEKSRTYGRGSYSPNPNPCYPMAL